MTGEIEQTRKERYGVTRKKHISITVDGHERIDTWARSQGISFSAAIETLALMGLSSDGATTFPVLTRDLLERIVGRQFNRFAKLLSLAAISAEAASLKTDVLLLQVVRQEAEAAPERFRETMTVSTDTEDTLAAQIRELRDQIRATAHQKAVQNLKTPLRQMELLLQLEADGEGGDDGERA